MKGYAPPSRVSDYWTLLSHVTPSFDNSYPKNVTTQLGQTVYLHCVVNNLGDKTVVFECIGLDAIIKLNQSLIENGQLVALKLFEAINRLQAMIVFSGLTMSYFRNPKSFLV
ncbi:uncharacterized protein TNCV_254651 [Trichonephila clavipes]|nr:uncharacterized protein TNCV_254651 [Trichonephila clavipes]